MVIGKKKKIVYRIIPFKPLKVNNRTDFEFWIENIITNIAGEKKKSLSRTEKQKIGSQSCLTTYSYSI